MKSNQRLVKKNIQWHWQISHFCSDNNMYSRKKYNENNISLFHVWKCHKNVDLQKKKGVVAGLLLRIG